MGSFSKDSYQPVFNPSPPSVDSRLNELANVTSLAPLNSTFDSGQLLGLNNSNFLLPLHMPGSPPVSLINSLVNLDNKKKKNDKKGDKIKAEDIEEKQVFNKNDDTMILEKPKLSCHQESAQEKGTLRSYVVPDAYQFMKMLMPVTNHEATISRGCAGLDKFHLPCPKSQFYLQAQLGTQKMGAKLK